MEVAKKRDTLVISDRFLDRKHTSDVMRFVDWHIFDSADCQLPVPSLL